MIYVTTRRINPYLYFGLAASLLTGSHSPFPDLSTALVLVFVSAHTCFCFLNQHKILSCFVDLAFHWFTKLKQLETGTNVCQNRSKRWGWTRQPGCGTAAETSWIVLAFLQVKTLFYMEKFWTKRTLISDMTFFDKDYKIYSIALPERDTSPTAWHL